MLTSKLHDRQSKSIKRAHLMLRNALSPCAFLIAVLLLSSLQAVAQDSKNASSEMSSAEIYKQRCASCHGQNLEGGNAQSMVDGVWQFGGDNGNIFRNIKFGISSVGMPDYQNALSDKQIRGVMKYMEEAQQRAGVEKSPIPEKLETRHYDVGIEKWIAAGLETPWALVFIDDETALLTERPGRLRMVVGGKLLPEPISGTPAVFARGQGGLLDVAIDPNYAENGWVYLSFAHSLDGTSDKETHVMTQVVRGKIREGNWVDNQVIYNAGKDAYSKTRYHYGSRFAFDRQGHLLFSIGDRGIADDAQDPHLPNGKIHRIRTDGSIPDDNPFADGANGHPSVFTYGNRNPQGLATHPGTGEIWETEHGPMGGDEVNLLKSGKNYGWPKASYGINYDGRPVADKLRLEGTVQPVLYWVPSIATCGAKFCVGEEFPRWQHNLLVGGLSHEELRRLVIADGRVIHQELILKNAGRVRAVACDPSGSVYVVLNSPDVVLKLTNQGEALRQ